MRRAKAKTVATLEVVPYTLTEARPNGFVRPLLASRVRSLLKLLDADPAEIVHYANAQDIARTLTCAAFETLGSAGAW